MTVNVQFETKANFTLHEFTSFNIEMLNLMDFWHIFDYKHLTSEFLYSLFFQPRSTLPDFFTHVLFHVFSHDTYRKKNILDTATHTCTCKVTYNCTPGLSIKAYIYRQIIKPFFSFFFRLQCTRLIRQNDHVLRYFRNVNCVHIWVQYKYSIDKRNRQMHNTDGHNHADRKFHKILPYFILYENNNGFFQQTCVNILHSYISETN